MEHNIPNMVAERRLTAMMLQEAEAILLEWVRFLECSKERRTVVELIGQEFSPNTTQNQERAVENGVKA